MTTEPEASGSFEPTPSGETLDADIQREIRDVATPSDETLDADIQNEIRAMPTPSDEILDADIQREVNEALGDASLMDIMDAEEMARRSDRETIHKAKVVAIQNDEIFVSLGAKCDGFMAASQFEGQELPAVGTFIEVVVEGFDEQDRLLRVSREGAVTQATWQNVEIGQVLEGHVTSHNRGGLAMEFQGIPGFMPISQIERFRVEDISGYVNQKLKCEVIEVRRQEKSIVVSRRSILEREAEEARAEALASLVPGKIVQGCIKNIMPYGAFVDIGGVDGLLHVSDMAHARIDDPRNVVQEGQNLELMVLKVDPETRKISLGLKQVLPDPWRDVATRYPVDSKATGRITKLMDFGAFVELEQGVEGLIPISEMTFEKRINHPREILSEGQTLDIKVLNVDADRKRISLSLKRLGDDPWIGAAVRWPAGGVVTARVRRISPFGAFLELTPGVEGLLHISELSHGRVGSVNEVLEEGQEVEVKVLSVDEDQRRIALSLKQRAEMPDYVGEASAASAPEPPAARTKRKRPLRGGLDR